MKQRLLDYLAAEREKMRGMSPAQAAQYIWQYYWLWIVSAVSLTAVFIYLLVLTLSAPKETWFYACFANVPPGFEMDTESAFCREFVEYAGYDLHKEALYFDTGCYCNPSKNPGNDHYYQKLIALLDGGILDVLVMEDEDLKTLGSTGRLLDLQGEILQVDERWTDRLIYCDYTGDGYDKSRVPVAIDLRGSRLTGPDGPYPEGCALGVSAQAQHTDQLEIFLAFLFEDAST